MNLTREQIKTMQAGPEMDALIQREIFGKCPHPISECGSHHDKNYHSWIEYNDTAEGKCYACGESLVYDYPCKDNPRQYGCPSFSTDIAAAWGMWESLKRVCSAYRFPDGRWSVWIDHPNEFSGLADTAALAICRAALLATLQPAEAAR